MANYKSVVILVLFCPLMLFENVHGSQSVVGRQFNGQIPLPSGLAALFQQPATYYKNMPRRMPGQRDDDPNLANMPALPILPPLPPPPTKAGVIYLYPDGLNHIAAGSSGASSSPNFVNLYVPNTQPEYYRIQYVEHNYPNNLDMVGAPVQRVAQDNYISAGYARNQ